MVQGRTGGILLRVLACAVAQYGTENRQATVYIAPNKERYHTICFKGKLFTLVSIFAHWIGLESAAFNAN